MSAVELELSAMIERAQLTWDALDLACLELERLAELGAPVFPTLLAQCQRVRAGVGPRIRTVVETGTDRARPTSRL